LVASSIARFIFNQLYIYICRTLAYTKTQNVFVEWLTLLSLIQEVPGSNLGLGTGYSDRGFSWFLPVPPGKCWDSTTLKLGHDHFLPNRFQFTIHHPIIWHYIILVTGKNVQ
jgi:hypothetical protein